MSRLITHTGSKHTDQHVVALVKEETGEVYSFTFVEFTKAETLRRIGAMASNPDLSFNWYDAAFLSQKVRDYECGGK